MSNRSVRMDCVMACRNLSRNCDDEVLDKLVDDGTRPANNMYEICRQYENQTVRIINNLLLVSFAIQ